MRMKAGGSYDPAVGRFMFWPFDGPVILDTLEAKKIDYKCTASLNQFGIILSFIENVIFAFEQNALREIVDWGNKCKDESKLE